jgi:putative transposase
MRIGGNSNNGATFGHFFKILDYIAEQAVAVSFYKNLFIPQWYSVIKKVRQAENSSALAMRCKRRNEIIGIKKLFDGRSFDINAAINLKRLGLGIFLSIKRRSGNLSVVESMDNSTIKEILHTRHRAAKKPTLYLYSG